MCGMFENTTARHTAWWYGCLASVSPPRTDVSARRERCLLESANRGESLEAAALSQIWVLRQITISKLILLLFMCSGCVTLNHHAVPVEKIPPELLGPSRSAKTPIDFSLLQQPVSTQYIVGPGDTLGIYVEDVLPADQPVPIHFPDFQSPRYEGQTIAPRVGTPILVDGRGQILLPFIESLHVDGMTLEQINEAIRRIYLDAGILKPGKENVFTSIIKPRYYKVTVIREDSAGTKLNQKGDFVLSKRGSAQVLEMPAYENDVLHALAATGGLPGDDAYDHVWVLRAQPRVSMVAWAEQLENGAMPEEISEGTLAEPIIKIPLRVGVGDVIPFGPKDILLNEGDIVFVESRKKEFFYVGGYLEGGPIPLPRDYDLDILGAIASASGNVNGPVGRNPGATQFRGGPSNLIPPSRAIIVRQLAGNKQINIEVNLKRALHDPQERILIQPGDLVLLKHTMPEILGNVVLSLVGVRYSIPNR